MMVGNVVLASNQTLPISVKIFGVCVGCGCVKDYKSCYRIHGDEIIVISESPGGVPLITTTCKDNRNSCLFDSSQSQPKSSYITSSIDNGTAVMTTQSQEGWTHITYDQDGNKKSKEYGKGSLPSHIGYMLDISIAGEGSVVSTDGNINCDSENTVCQVPFPNAAIVTLTATPNSGHQFVNWSGDCPSTNSTVNVTVDATKTCTANFAEYDYTLSITKEGEGNGTITSTSIDINCGTDSTECTQGYIAGTPVILTATPDDDSYFLGWDGACKESRRTT